MEALSVSFRKSNQPQDYVFLEKKLANGRFSVFQCNSPSSRSSYALKMFPKDNVSKAHYQREKRMLSKLEHPNIIQYAPIFGHTANHKYDVIITSLAQHGSLLSLCKEGVFYGNVKLIRTYFKQLIEGIEYIHSKRIAHLDLKPDNVLVGEDFLLKIMDFDLSQEFGERYMISGGTRDFRAPEIIHRECNNIFAADIYSAGIVLYYLLTGETPFFESTINGKFELLYYDTFEYSNSMFWKLKGDKTKFGIFSDDVKALLNGMLKKDPRDRWTLSEIKASKWYWGPVYDRTNLKIEMEKAINYKKKKDDRLNVTMYW